MESLASRIPEVYKITQEVCVKQIINRVVCTPGEGNSFLYLIFLQNGEHESVIEDQEKWFLGEEVFGNLDSLVDVLIQRLLSTQPKVSYLINREAVITGYSLRDCFNQVEPLVKEGKIKTWTPYQ